MADTIQRYKTSGGLELFKLPVVAFPNHVTNCYLLLDDAKTLIDVGSGMPFSRKSLLDCFAALETEHGLKMGLPDLGRVIITHGHIDHFGGLIVINDLAPQARIGIHALDASTVRHFEERLIVSSRNLQIFLARAGLTEGEVEKFVEENKWSKNMFKATRVDFTFDEGDTIEGGYRVYHAPGHCPGQVCLGLDDILLTADHVLARTTPNQSPESIVRYNGLGHYFEALRKMRKETGYRLGLGGHEADIEDIPKRIDDIIAFHERRLEKTLEICAEPTSIRDIALALFPRAKDYHVLLALTEAGAHVEYLHERGRLVVTNIEEVEREKNPVPLYRRA